LNDWRDLYHQLKALKEDKIEPGDFDLAKAVSEAKKYAE